MTINEHLMQFCGKPVVDFDDIGKITDPRGVAVRVSLSYREREEDDLYWEDKLDQLLADPQVEELEALVIGPWEDVGTQDTEFIVELLVKYRDKLRNVREFFFGDVTVEESECSWLDHRSVAELFTAFPKLTNFSIRGCGSLTFGENLEHGQLRSLVIQCSGLSESVMQELTKAELPNLEHLEIWLGEENYGADYEMEDLTRLLNENQFPKLVYLGLKNCEKQNEVAELVTTSSLIKQIKVLDLSMGTLTDEGAERLLSCPQIKSLEYLDLHHHYLTDGMMTRLRGLGIEINLEEQLEGELDGDEIWRFIAVGE